MNCELKKFETRFYYFHPIMETVFSFQDSRFLFVTYIIIQKENIHKYKRIYINISMGKNREY